MTIDWSKVREHPSVYKVFVSDNFHYQDPDEQYVIIGFASAEEALEKCRNIVETSLQESSEPGRSAEEIYKYYTMFGDDPSVGSPEGQPAVGFSGWNYAKEHAHRFVC